MKFLRALSRRLHAAMLRTRVAQLHLVATTMSCGTAPEAVLQAIWLAQACAARLELAVLEQRS